MRFDLIDRVIASDAQQISALKLVTCAEEYLGDHFPGFPILPGVMMLETLVQAARHLVAGREDAPELPLVMQEARNVRYAGMVKPGQTLQVQVTLRKAEGSQYDFQGTGSVDGQVAVQARFTLAPVPGAA